MHSDHRIIFESARRMKGLDNESVHLIVTSPPYPMIEMWDTILGRQDPAIGRALKKGQGVRTFELMHGILDKVWGELYRVLKPGGLACINIGDATRTLNANFRLYANHARILNAMLALGFSALPAVIWRKQTNAPNKFMGSGMMPPGAYVTLEHEYILILRKGAKREFASIALKENRRASAYFWEERNNWFSDVWFDLKGTTQRLFDAKLRNRSGAYPFELPYRLINMFSVKGDTVLDPFLGLGTTLLAAMASGRNSIGFEIDSSLGDLIAAGTNGMLEIGNRRIEKRLQDHIHFATERLEVKGPFKYRNEAYGFPVVTNQERHLLLNRLQQIERIAPDRFRVSYDETPQAEFLQDWEPYFSSTNQKPKAKKPEAKKPVVANSKKQVRQRSLF